MNTHTLIFATLVALLGACTPLNAVKMDYQTVTVQSATATPRMLVEKGRTQLDFGSGDRRLTFQFSPESVKRVFGLKALVDFQLAEGTLQVGETVLQLRVKPESLKEDLSYALELIGLAENTRIVLQGKAYDPSGKVLGELNYNRLITQPVDRVTLDQMLNTLQTDINAKR